MKKLSYAEKASRSQAYQYIYNEISFDNADMRLLLEHGNHDVGAVYTERFYELEDELIKLVYKEMTRSLNLYQRMCLTMLYIEGMSQVEIAKVFGVNQSSVVKCMQGNTMTCLIPDDPRGKRTKTGNWVMKYGGALKKIRNACLANEEICRILEEMRDEVNV
jgi:hypothetical protein